MVYFQYRAGAPFHFSDCSGLASFFCPWCGAKDEVFHVVVCLAGPRVSATLLLITDIAREFLGGYSSEVCEQCLLAPAHMRLFFFFPSKDCVAILEKVRDEITDCLQTLQSSSEFYWHVHIPLFISPSEICFSPARAEREG